MEEAPLPNVFSPKEKITKSFVIKEEEKIDKNLNHYII